jgi:hypothetical protein
MGDGNHRLAGAPTPSAVVPIYNEEEVLPQLLQRLDRITSTIRAEWEWLFVDDGRAVLLPLPHRPAVGHR